MAQDVLLLVPPSCPNCGARLTQVSFDGDAPVITAKLICARNHDIDVRAKTLTPASWFGRLGFCWNFLWSWHK